MNMTFRRLAVLALLVGLAGCSRLGLDSRNRLELSREELANKIKGGWAGQMIGVAIGGPTEFRAKQAIYDKPLGWSQPQAIKDCLNQDDLYVEMTFADVMDRQGLDASMVDYGKAFGESQYKLWHANRYGRENIRAGIMPPQSGDPAHNRHWRDIDFQIEADFIGLMCPGLPRASNAYCDRVGHVMNYGDGVYGGMFIAAMYAAAFHESDPEQIVRAGLAVLPPQSDTYKSLSDLLLIHRQYPRDWSRGWAEYNKLWDERGEPCPEGKGKPYNIDAFLNSAYVAIGLLYGQGDFQKTIEIATRCGQDSDCNAASAAGILGTVLGYDKLPADWRAELEKVSGSKFAYTNYSFDSICASTLKRAEANILEAGGKVVDGGRLRIRLQSPKPAAMEVWKGETLTQGQSKS